MKKTRLQKSHATVPSKGQCDKIFLCCFFRQIAPPGPMRATLGQFQFLPNIGIDIGQKVGSALYDTPQNGNSACIIYHGMATLGFQTLQMH